tara:strand:- start:36 stop:782 length:747 start_codon:yes stop_codon:yes gene_type:complete
MSEDYQDIPEILGDLETFLKNELPKKETIFSFQKLPNQLVNIYKNRTDIDYGGGGVSWQIYDDNFEIIVCNIQSEQAAEYIIGGDDPLTLENRQLFFPKATEICQRQFEVTQAEQVETMCTFQDSGMWIVSTMIPATMSPDDFTISSKIKRRGVSRGLGDKEMDRCVYHTYTPVHKIPGAIYAASDRYQSEVIQMNICDKEHVKPKAAQKIESGFEVLKHRDRYSQDKIVPFNKKEILSLKYKRMFNK